MITITKKIVPEAKWNIKCPYVMSPKGITVHNTANDASARSEITYMSNNNYETSFHYAVDDKEAVQGLPLNRNGWHASDGPKGFGNRQTIAIEICYSKSGGWRFDKAEENASELIAFLIKQYGWTIDNVKRHYDYAPDKKYCPHRTMDKGWDRFLNMIKIKLNSGTGTSGEPNYTGVITYQACCKANGWLPEVNKCNSTANGYIGIGVDPICGFRCKPQYGELLYQAHTLGGSWNAVVTSNDYGNGYTNSYAGILGKPTDMIKIKSTKGWVKYRVKTKEDGWLPWVDSRTQTGTESYGGIAGHEIIGIQMY